MTANIRPEHSCVVGLGWGDEGKGKIVDLLGGAFDIVVRYNGGANAGHTVCIGDDKFALHLLPTGVLRANATGVIGPGVVVDPFALIDELDGLESRGVPAGERLRISDRAHLVMPWHQLEDRLAESSLGEPDKIGTTSRGIGPCYADKMRRSTALRMVDLLNRLRLEKRVRQIDDLKRRMFSGAFGDDSLADVGETCDRLYRVADRLVPLITDTTQWLADQVDAGRSLFFEGANGMLLDVDHGTYPYVTSSATGPQGIASGGGVSPELVKRRIGVTKAYSTRVGGGPFPTELVDKTGDRIREQGHEFGTTTGRPRRCGWLDAVAIRQGVRLGGINEIALTHLDTLSGFEKVGVCVAYRVDDEQIDYLPTDLDRLSRLQPVIEWLEGWEGDFRAKRAFNDLPAKAQAYVCRLEELLESPISIVSVGPGREQTIVRSDAWSDLIRHERGA